MEQLRALLHIRHLLFNKALRILLITNAMILISTAMLGPIYAIFVEKAGGDLLDASFAGGMFALSAGLTVLVSGRYADRTHENKKRIVAFGYAVIGLGYLFYTQVTSVWHLLAVQVLVGFGEAFYSPSFDSLYTDHIDGKKSATQWGAWEAINYFSLSAGAVLGGVIVSSFGFNVLFYLMAGLCLSSAVYIWNLPKRSL